MLASSVERWRPLAQQYAASAGTAYGVFVPVELVLAHVHVESRGNPLAKRKEKDGEWSRGLLQVKEATAKWLGLANTAALLTPSVGLAYGVRYLAYQLKRYGGNPARAAAAYNAGSVRYTAGSGEKFVNQKYVDDVLAAMRKAATTSSPGSSSGGLSGWILPVGLGAVALAAVAARATRHRRARAA